VAETATTKNTTQTGNARFEEILNRLRDCEGLVEQELQEYQSVSPASGDATAVDYLLSIVIPVYNEEATVARVVSRVAALPLNSELVIVDDCSTDGTRAILQRVADLPQVQVISKEKNAGKGAALRTGFEAATGDFIIVQDADLEYDPRDIPPIIQPLLRGEADVVYGSRFIGDVMHDKSFVTTKAKRSASRICSTRSGASDATESTIKRRQDGHFCCRAGFCRVRVPNPRGNPVCVLRSAKPLLRLIPGLNAKHRSNHAKNSSCTFPFDADFGSANFQLRSIVSAAVQHLAVENHPDPNSVT